MPKKVVCAMSGGVDSSVVAALLKRAGFDVKGIFLKLYDSPKFKIGEKRAKKIAKILRIPIQILDLRKEFKKKVIDYFLAKYRQNLTPNPCVVCNKEIKFGLLLDKILTLDAEYLATGHYVKKLKTQNSKPKTTAKNSKLIYKLLRARDKDKDQSYFLWMLNQNQLKHSLFPIGDYTKAEVRNLAKKFRLPAFKWRESEEICFIQTTVNDFLARHIEPTPGQIIDPVGKILGQHRGLAFYTIGQRKGIGLPGGPYWVLDKDLKKNLLIVTKNEKDLLKKKLICEKVNWISGQAPKLPLKVKAKIRYRHEPATATIKEQRTENKEQHLILLEFEKPQRAITPGQSVVFYLPRSSPKAIVRGKGEELLGGGMIM